MFTYPARTTSVVALATLGLVALTGCSSGAGQLVSGAAVTDTVTAPAISSTGGATTRSTTSPAAVAAAPSAAASGTLKYQKIVELFSIPFPCRPDGNTGEMTDCYLKQVVAVDHVVDSVQRRRFATATTAAQRRYLADDAHWLAKRTSNCVAANNTGGTIDELDRAGCLLQASKDRLKALS